MIEDSTTRPISPAPADVSAAADILRGDPDPRSSFCAAAAKLLRADSATLWEPTDGELYLSASTRGDQPRPSTRLPLGTDSPVCRAVRDGRRCFVGDTASDRGTQRANASGLRTLLAEPVRFGRDAVGAIALGWRQPLEDVDPLTGSFLSLMALQAGIAIERTDVSHRLERQALTDPLTELPNRRGLARELDREMATAVRRRSSLGFALMDLDNFKAFNDRHGHAAGDRALVDAARSWSASVRAQDILARYGGEEFVLLLPDCARGPLSPLQIVDRVREATPEGQTVSAGLAIWDGVEPAHRLAERADAALYLAKGRGRNQTLAA